MKYQRYSSVINLCSNTGNGETEAFTFFCQCAKFHCAFQAQTCNSDTFKSARVCFKIENLESWGGRYTPQFKSESVIRQINYPYHINDVVTQLNNEFKTSPTVAD